jgi:hypothetical protein
MRVTAAARRRPVRCVADDSALSSVKVTVYNDIPRKGSPRGLPISSTGSPDSGSQHAHPDPTATIVSVSIKIYIGFTSIFIDYCSARSRRTQRVCAGSSGGWHTLRRRVSTHIPWCLALGT